MASENTRINSVPLHQSMIERPLPFFGAGGEAAAISLFLLFTAQSMAGLISITMLMAILMSAVATYIIKEFREVDPFGPESFTVGVTTPSKFVSGYSITDKPGKTFSSFLD